MHVKRGSFSNLGGPMKKKPESNEKRYRHIFAILKTLKTFDMIARAKILVRKSPKEILPSCLFWLRSD